MKKIIGIFIVILLIGTATPAIGIIEKNHEAITLNNADWTIMVYMDGDNDLESWGITDFLEMSSVGSTSKVNIVVQFDRIPGYSTDYDDWNSTKRYLITKDMIPNNANAIMDIGEANMGDPQTAIDFIVWAKYNYPANHYCFIFWDHGRGWKSFGNQDLIKSTCMDITDGDKIDMNELVDVMSTTTINGENKFDIIGFDACLMQMIEIAYELANYGIYITASEQYEPYYGWSYDEFLKSLTDDSSISSDVLCSYIVNTYEGPTLSAIDLGFADELLDCINDLSLVLQDEENKEIIKIALVRSIGCSFPDYKDLYDITDKLIESQEDIINPDEIIQNAYKLQNKINETVISVNDEQSRFHGLSIYLPFGSYYELYDELLFARDSQWNEFLNWLCEGQTNNPPNSPVITGPSNCKPNKEYKFSFVTTDPEGDDVIYKVNWGDGNSSTSGYISSGEELILTYSWDKPGAYCVSAYCIDRHNEYGYPTSFLVAISKSISIENFNNPWLSRLIKRFPILESLLLE